MERREHPRVDVNLRVRVRYDNVDDFVEQFAPNMSKGGFFLRSREPYPVGTQLHFEIQLKDGSSVLKGMGKVTWSQPSAGPGEGERLCGMGVKFIGLDASSAELVRRILEHKEGQSSPSLKVPAPAPAPPPQEEPAEAAPEKEQPEEAEKPAVAPAPRPAPPTAPLWRRVPLRIWLLLAGAALGALVAFFVLSLVTAAEPDASDQKPTKTKTASISPPAVENAPEVAKNPPLKNPPEAEPVEDEEDLAGEEAWISPPPIPLKKPAVKRRFGYFSLNTKPWVEVYLGPRKLGVTPLVKVKLRAGKHRMRLVNWSDGIDSPLVVTIRPGKTTKLMKNFSR